MQTVRRFYLYFIAAVSLAVLATGLTNLFGLALEQISESLGWRTVIGRDAESVRREVSLFTALVIVALPIWLVHWWLAERAVHRPDASAEPERQSTIRALYITLALLASFQFWFVSAQDLLGIGIRELFGSDELYGGSVPMAIAGLAVTGAIWAYHVRVRLHDIRLGPLDSGAVFLPRLYVYIAMFAGATTLLFGTTELLNLIGDAIFGSRGITVSERWWVPPLASGVSAVVVGAAIWLTHWWYSLMRLERGDWYSLSEQRSMLRGAYLYLIILVGTIATLVALSSSIETVLRAVLDVPEATGAREFLRHLIEPLVWASPFLGFWLFHRQRLVVESLQFTTAEVRSSIRRFYSYGLTLIGLAFTAVGSAYVLGILIDLTLGGTRTIDYSASWWREQVSQFGAVALAGVGVWLWHWYTVQQARQADPETERWTTSRRLFLYITLAASLVAALVSVSVVIYRLFNVLLDVTPDGGLASSISAALGVAIIAVMLLIYHGVILRQDTLARPAAVEGPIAMPLVLTGPSGADLDAELTELRAHLHPGFGLRPSKEHG